MNLSAVLDKYYVIALGQSEIVGYHVFDDGDGEKIAIEWNDSEDFESHRQEFVDQEIAGLNAGARGAFYVVDTDDDKVGFIALDGVDLRALPASDVLLQAALRNLPQYITKSGLVGPDKHSAMQCFEVLRDAVQRNK